MRTPRAASRKIHHDRILLDEVDRHLGKVLGYKLVASLLVP